MADEFDAIVVGSGPNGLAAAITLAQAGLRVKVFEAKEAPGGGCRTAELTLPGFKHDMCSAIHPMAHVSPFFANLNLQKYGLQWAWSPVAVAHPLPNGRAAALYQSLERTVSTLGRDATAWTNLLQPFVRAQSSLFGETLRPARIPQHPLLMARFALAALHSCRRIVDARFQTDEARALFAGCAAHSFLPLDDIASGSFGLMLALSGHAVGWPCAVGGSGKIVDALVAKLYELGGVVQTNTPIQTLNELPRTRAILFDLTPRQILALAGDHLPSSYKKSLANYKCGPGVFKVDWALRAPIPWKNSECREAATVHVGGTFEEIAASEAATWTKRPDEKPFVLVAQQSLFDSTRAPAGKHTGWAYCHVPNGCAEDMTERIEKQVERFAPGFRDIILARHTTPPNAYHAYNPNLIGGDICGGANTLRQTIFRPVARWDPFSTPNPRLFICSSSTPPGGGVHGMCGYWAAHSALRRVFKKQKPPT